MAPGKILRTFVVSMEKPTGKTNKVPRGVFERWPVTSRDHGTETEKRSRCRCRFHSDMVLQPTPVAPGYHPTTSGERRENRQSRPRVTLEKPFTRPPMRLFLPRLFLWSLPAAKPNRARRGLEPRDGDIRNPASAPIPVEQLPSPPRLANGRDDTKQKGRPPPGLQAGLGGRKGGLGERGPRPPIPKG